MSTIAIIGAGRGLGAAVARKFGAHGFDVALISRTQANVDALAAELQQAGVNTRGYAADVRDTDALTAVLDRAVSDLGPIDVLDYSPIPQREFLRPVLATTRDDLIAAVEFSVLGPVAAVGHVLPGMRERGRGTVLFVNGGSAARPNARVAGTSVAFAGESAYAQMLHTELADAGVHVAQLIIPGAIRTGHPTHDPDVLADKLWAIHTERGDFRVYAEDLDK
ncbi:SDR family NAD(P)-dependent oxidoreductase [Rhodococcus sp. NPDC057529]|uniref:SDR family NAD(P)-dependent oxidoreductase n=1 Tax=Rhodococcus sp. NPDC057529 TaxID=3346158 RepID=UPI00366DF203